MSLKNSIKVATIEFAGVKFKSSASSGNAYLRQIQDFTMNPLLASYPHLQHIVICEEKYRFTPDDQSDTKQNKVHVNCSV